MSTRNGAGPRFAHTMAGPRYSIIFAHEQLGDGPVAPYPSPPRFEGPLTSGFFSSRSMFVMWIGAFAFTCTNWDSNLLFDSPVGDGRFELGSTLAEISRARSHKTVREEHYSRATAGYVRPTRLHQQSPGELEKALFAFNTAKTRFLEFG